MKLYSILKPGSIKVNCTASTTEGILSELLQHLELQNKITGTEVILEKLIEREKLGSTSIGYHSAVPHTKLKDLEEPIVAVGTSKAGIMYTKKDKEPVHFIVLILSPNKASIKHLQVLAAAASLIKKSGALIDDIISSAGPEDVMRIIQSYEEAHD